jgi:hypothetical protein
LTKFCSNKDKLFCPLCQFDVRGKSVIQLFLALSSNHLFTALAAPEEVVVEEILVVSGKQEWLLRRFLSPVWMIFLVRLEPASNTEWSTQVDQLSCYLQGMVVL